jgi:hypothetical protein
VARASIEEASGSGARLSAVNLERLEAAAAAADVHLQRRGDTKSARPSFPRTPSGRDAWQAKLGKVLCPACELLLGCTRGPAHTAGVRAGTLRAAPIAHALLLAHFVPAAVCSHSVL